MAISGWTSARAALNVDGRQVDLSAREFAVAAEFFRRPDQVLSREQLLSRLWGFDSDPGSNIVDIYVRYLRAKLGPTDRDGARHGLPAGLSEEPV